MNSSPLFCLPPLQQCLHSSPFWPLLLLHSLTFEMHRQTEVNSIFHLMLKCTKKTATQKHESRIQTQTIKTTTEEEGISELVKKENPLSLGITFQNVGDYSLHFWWQGHREKAFKSLMITIHRQNCSERNHCSNNCHITNPVGALNIKTITQDWSQKQTGM